MLARGYSQSIIGATPFFDTPFFRGIAALKFKSEYTEALGKNLGGSVMLFLVPKIVEVMTSWAAK